jgi:serine/threonine-protein kinase HipA
MNGRYVGQWRQVRGGRDQFRYDPAWREDPQARALSLSLPITADGVITSPLVRNYFDNLLPDDPRIRERLKIRFGSRSADTFDLLEALGRDCVGAVQLLPVGAAPEGWDRVDSHRLTTKDVEAILRAVPTSAAPILGSTVEEEDFRISIAGGQEKTALLKIGRTWHLPHGATPTTHIMKLPLGLVGGMKLDLSHSVDNEWLCAALLTALGIPMPATEIGRFGEQRVLVVERFDRRWQAIGEADPRSSRFVPPPDAWIARLPQEDFCQATGRSHDHKYEAQGGAGMEEILRILARAEHPIEDRRTFLLAQLAFWLLAAIDGHAKNFSIFHRRGGGYELTPLYDVLSAWPVIGPRADQLALKKVKLAMAVHGSSGPHYKLTEIQPRHFQMLAEVAPEANVWPAMLTLAGNVDDAIHRVESRLPKDFAFPVWERVTTGIRKQAGAFLKAAHP